MKLGIAKTANLNGLDANIIEVQSFLTDALPGFTIVGLPDTSLKESKDRVRAAFSSIDMSWPQGKIVINLCPAEIKKSGTAFDLPIAVSIMSAANKKMNAKLSECAFFGELGLNGKILKIPGVLPLIIFLKNNKELNIKKIFVPQLCYEEAVLALGDNTEIEIISVKHIIDIVSYFKIMHSEKLYLISKKIDKLFEENNDISSLYLSEEPVSQDFEKLDLNQIIGQQNAKKILEIAAAGRHNLLLVGPPGTGKTMLANRIITILPKLDIEESLEVTSIHSIKGNMKINKLIDTPVFQAPHHTATAPSIVGGGSVALKPGLVSLAHKGVLFLDEAPEFSPRVLQTLRGPLESKEVIIDRMRGSVSYPADFQIILAANPCPCGMYIGRAEKCTCSSSKRSSYFSRLSGPLLDRIDLSATLVSGNHNKQNEHDDLNELNECSQTIRERVTIARYLQKTRLKNTPWIYNSEVPGSYLRKYIGMDNEILEIINKYVNMEKLSLRGADRSIRTAFTISDLRNAKILIAKYPSGVVDNATDLEIVEFANMVPTKEDLYYAISIKPNDISSYI